MNIDTSYIIFGSLIVVILFITIFGTKNIREGAYLQAYSFGFPTHGSYNYGGGPLKGGIWWRSPRRYGGWYYRNFIKPYLTGACYSSSKDEDCQPQYSKTQRDSNGDGILDENDEWLCCRERDLF